MRWRLSHIQEMLLLLMCHFLNMQTCSHTPPIARIGFLQVTDTNFFSCLVHSAKERRPHPADSALKIHGEVHEDAFKDF